MPADPWLAHWQLKTEQMPLETTEFQRFALHFTGSKAIALPAAEEAAAAAAKDAPAAVAETAAAADDSPAAVAECPSSSGGGEGVMAVGNTDCGRGTGWAGSGGIVRHIDQRGNPDTRDGWPVVVLGFGTGRCSDGLGEVLEGTG
jgi:hypothetical protein